MFLNGQDELIKKKRQHLNYVYTFSGVTSIKLSYQPSFFDIDASFCGWIVQRTLGGTS